MRLAIFTICNNDAVPGASVLFASVQRFLPGAARVLVLADERHAAVPYPADATVIAADELGIDEFLSLAFRYDKMEFRAALKPAAFQHLFAQGFTHGLYLDPDTEVFSALPNVTGALADGAAVVLTPHILAPAEGQDGPDDVAIMRGGVYNLGILGMSDTAEARAVLDWWAHWLRRHCVNEKSIGLYLDQKFMDLVPGFAKTARILRDPGLGLGYWNLPQRHFAPGGPEGHSVDGRMLGLFHYAGFDPATPDRLSCHTPLFQGAEMAKGLRDFLAGYARRLVAAGAGTIPAGSYAYGRFASGVPIPHAVRRMFRDDHEAWAGDPFAEYEAWAHLPLPGAPTGMGSAIPSLLQHWLQARTPELHHLALHAPQGAAGMTRWWLDHGAAAGFDARFLEPQALAAGLRGPRLGATRLKPCKDLADASVIGTLPDTGLAGLAAQAQISSLTHLAGHVQRLHAGAPQPVPGDAVLATGRLLVFCTAPDQLAPCIQALQPRLPQRAYRVLVPATEGCASLPAGIASLVDEIWAPTRFIQAKLAATTELPVLHLPLALSLPAPSALPPPGLAGRAYVFTKADGLPGDGGLLAAVQAFRAAFAHAPGPRPALVIRADGAGGAAAWRDLASGDPDMIILDPGMDHDAAGAVLAGAACLLLLHRGQAVGLPAARAMAWGVPVVATGYGGCTGLLTPDTGFPVDFRLAPAPGGAGEAEADPTHAAWLLREVFAQPDAAKRRAGQARLAFDGAHHPANVAAKQAARLRLLGLM